MRLLRGGTGGVQQHTELLRCGLVAQTLTCEESPIGTMVEGNGAGDCGCSGLFYCNYNCFMNIRVAASVDGWGGHLAPKDMFSRHWETRGEGGAVREAPEVM